MPHDIFISYSRRDLTAVKRIKEELEAAGFSCWMDLEGIESGSEEFTAKIAEAVGGSTSALFFLSEASQASRWSLNELRLARLKGKHVVLVRFNDDPMSDQFMLEFGGTDVIDWRTDEQREKLLNNLRMWKAGRSGSPPSGSGGQLPPDLPSKTPMEREIDVLFCTIVRDGSVNRFSGPCFNFVLPTCGGRKYWHDLSVADGWKFQTNRFLAYFRANRVLQLPHS